MTAAVVPVGVVVPTLGGRGLGGCLRTVERLDPAPHQVVVVASGGSGAGLDVGRAQLASFRQRLGFAEAVNAGIEQIERPLHVAVLNDDTVVDRGWLAPLVQALKEREGLAAVQGPVLTGDGLMIDGCGIVLDQCALPVQAGRGQPATGAPTPDILAVSGTAALWRREAIEAARLSGGAVFDPSFDSYHEDLDLGLRLLRLGWRAACVGDASVRHLGSASGSLLRWRQPRWLILNRWRAFAGNLTRGGLLALWPTLLRGELRAVRTVARSSWRALPLALVCWLEVPAVVVRSWRRQSPGARLERLPGGS